MATKTNGNIGKYALQSRILVLCMQVIFNFLMHDHDAKVFNPPVVHSSNIVDWVVEVMLSGFRRWDAIYFLHIAEYGYTYENTLAFFPGFPFAVRLVANSVLFPLQYILNYGNVLLISGFIINMVCFVQATKYLHALTLCIMKDETLAMKVVQLFCINPASVFFSAAYSEAMFAMFTFWGMLKLESGNFIIAALLFGCSGTTRSNGLINIGFLMYKLVHESLARIMTLISQKDNHIQTKFIGVIIIVIWCILRATMYSVIVAIPFLVYQYYAYFTFCISDASSNDIPSHVLNYGSEKGYKMAHTGISPWCKDTLPFSYSYVQNTHWNVGFMKYYQFKQIPNFLLAMPIVIIGVTALLSYTKRNFITVVTLGIFQAASRNDTKKSDDPILSSESNIYGYYSMKVYVYLIHMVALITFGMLFMHVQVLTRFVCSSCPLLYFFLAWVTVPNEQLESSQSHANRQANHNGTMETTAEEKRQIFSGFMEWEDNWTNKAIYIYFDLYFFVGIAAFVNFLPFT